MSIKSIIVFGIVFTRARRIRKMLEKYSQMELTYSARIRVAQIQGVYASRIFGLCIYRVESKFDYPESLTPTNNSK